VIFEKNSERDEGNVENTCAAGITAISWESKNREKQGGPAGETGKPRLL
jgi:hypothetical protein